jgi:hypothetical protein
LIKRIIADGNEKGSKKVEGRRKQEFCRTSVCAADIQIFAAE